MIRHLSIRGRVQGVGYRAWVAQLAASRGLQGWVRNRRDGSVEAVVSGPADAVAQVIAACHRGPALARVDAVVASDANADMLALRGDAAEFAMLPTL